MSQHDHDHSLEAEAAAFDERIDTRTNAGFIPDLRRAVKCDYFYKSFWRDPVCIDLYVGEMVRHYLAYIKKYHGPGARVLDIGCGAGYISLELARAGHHVEAFDISEKCIQQAKQTLSDNPYLENFGSLHYSVNSIEEFSGQNFDVILCSGVLHHLEDFEDIVKKLAGLTKKGLLICHEPCHDGWRKQDAAVVALVRGLLSATGNWYEESLADDIISKKISLDDYTEEIHEEYVTEQDKEERGQSPNDNITVGEGITSVLSQYFDQLDYEPSHSFIYRVLGGIRGNDELIHKTARFLASYDRQTVLSGIFKPNYFFYAGRIKK